MEELRPWLLVSAIALLAVAQAVTLALVLRQRRHGSAAAGKAVALACRVTALQQRNYQLWCNVRSIGHQVGWSEDAAFTQAFDPQAPARAFAWEPTDDDA